MSCLYCKYQAKGSTDKPFLVDTASVNLKFVMSSSNSCLTTLHFVSPYYYLSAASLLRSLVTHQYQNLITHKPQGKITRRHSNHCDSTARGNVKTPLLAFTLSQCIWSSGLASLFSSSSSDLSLIPRTPLRKFQLVAFLQGDRWQLHGPTHPHLISHKPLGGRT